MAPIGFFGIMYVPTNLIIPEDMAATTANILANTSLYRLSIFSALVTQILQILLVLVLYKLLAQVSKVYAVLMVVFILVAVPIAMLNELNNIAVLQIVTNPNSFAGFNSLQLHDLMSLFLLMHEKGIIIAQFFWGLWLVPLGYLVFKSGYIPKLLGILLIIGGTGYLIDSTTLVLLPNFGITVSEFTFIGELLFPLWLLIKGVKTKNNHEQV